MATKMNIIMCLSWAPKGVANPNPQKIELSTEELEKIINKDKARLKKNEKSVRDVEMKDATKEAEDSIDEYDFDKYDEEPNDVHCHIADIVTVGKDGKDPLITNEDDNDSDKEDDIIKETDNLLLVGHVEDCASTLEVYIYNEFEGSFYCHHDTLLSSYPLCMEWINFDPSDPKPSNLCAIGNMEGDIEVWDLDLIDALEPAYKLKSEPKRKRILRDPLLDVPDDTDSILDLAWNEGAKHLLASASVEKTVKVWDLQKGIATRKFTNFKDRVQSLEWNPRDIVQLLVGSADKEVYVFDSYEEKVTGKWKIYDEVEKVIWCNDSTNYCLAGTNHGEVHCLDMRSDKPLWNAQFHSGEITGMSYSTSCRNALATTGNDGLLKIWKCGYVGEPVCVHEEKCDVGPIVCLDACPDNTHTFAVGGNHQSHNIKVYDVSTVKEVNKAFRDQLLLKSNEPGQRKRV